MKAGSANDRVRFGIIGVGGQGSSLLGQAVELHGAECAAACDVYDGRLTLAREIAGDKLPVTRRYQELLDNQEIDCIVAIAARGTAGSLSATTLAFGIHHAPRFDNLQ